MRSRTVREGSVGLLFLLGIGLFGALILWLRGTYFGDRTYQFTVEFANAAGMQIGTPVRYRGVTIGKVTDIKPGANGVDVEIQIVQTDLAIPRNVAIEANQSGLIGENSIDIMPANTIPVDIQGVKPIDPNCQERNLIICNNARFQGRVGVSLDELIRVTVRFANIYTDPRFFNNINSTLQNASTAAQGVTQLTRDLSGLTASLKQELRDISVAVNAVGQTANKLGGTANKFGETADKLNRTIDKFDVSADRVTVAATQTTGKINATVDKFSSTADRVSGAVSRLSNTADQTAARVAVTADRASGLVTNLNNLLDTNKASLVSTLNNLSQASEQLRVTVANLSPAIDRVTQGELIRNLETLSANAAQASTNIRDFSNAANNPTNLLVLQQTLDSARVTFQNAQKITSDLDDLTGDPAFRNNLRNLVNGLSGLVSSTEQLQQQVEVAQFLAPMAEATNMQMPHVPVVNAPVSVSSPRGEDNRNFQIPQSTATKEKKNLISNER